MKALGMRISNPDFASAKKGKLPLEGLTFVITGTLPKPRKEVEDLIESQGGHASSAVSASTNYLVAGDNPGSKLQKAKDLGIKTVSYEELLGLIEGKRNPGLFD